MKKLLVVALLATILSVSLGTGLAMADGKPNNQACSGIDVSSYATEGNSSGLAIFEAGMGFGQFVASVAQTTNGFGDEELAHHAGEIPDEFIPNTCN